jgi:hypothetical protein
MLDVYRRFLDYIVGASARFFFSSPREVARRLGYVQSV